MTLQNKILELLQDSENRKIVNEGQHHFIVQYELQNVFIFFKNTIIDVIVKDEKYEIIDKDLLVKLRQPFDFFVLRWCIKLLPEFDVPNPRYIKCGLELGKKEYDFEDVILAYNNGFGAGQNQTRTLSQAILESGAMTVEELENAYKIYVQRNNQR